MTKRQLRTFRRVCGALAVLSFFFLLGSAGALEQDMVTIPQAIVQMAVGLGAFALFAWLAGGFE